MRDSEALTRRDRAASKYRPQHVRLLLVAEAPPSSEDRYFYFEDVRKGDSLFRYVFKGLFGVKTERNDKSEALRKLREDGVFLIDVSPVPIESGTLVRVAAECGLVAKLVKRCEEIAPERIIPIKASVYDVAFAAMKAAGLPVVDARLPFPSSGQQKRFEEAFGAALDTIGWRPPPGHTVRLRDR